MMETTSTNFAHGTRSGSLSSSGRRGRSNESQNSDPSVSTTATLPNGEVWEYYNGAWRARPTQDDDQQQIDALDDRLDDVEQDIDGIESDLGDDSGLTQPISESIAAIQARLVSIENLDVSSAISALALAQQDIIELKSKVNTLELTSFLILE